MRKRCKWRTHEVYIHQGREVEYWATVHGRRSGRPQGTFCLPDGDSHAREVVLIAGRSQQRAYTCYVVGKAS